jgi:hypothetical protein
MLRLHVVWKSRLRVNTDSANLRYFFNVMLPAGTAYNFSRIASSADDVTQAMANLFDLMPALQEYNSGDPSSDLTKFRDHLVAIKQTVLQNPAEPKGKNVQRELPPPMVSDDPENLESARSHLERLASPSIDTAEGSMLRDLELPLQILDKRARDKSEHFYEEAVQVEREVIARKQNILKSKYEHKRVAGRLFDKVMN